MCSKFALHEKHWMLGKQYIFTIIKNRLPAGFLLNYSTSQLSTLLHSYERLNLLLNEKYIFC